MERQVSIYALCDPDTENIRYIGQTVNLKKRTYEHINKVHIGNRRKQDWIDSLVSQGKTPFVKILYVVEQSMANQAEMDAIAQAKTEGFDLLNGTPHAQGGSQVGWAHGKEKTELSLPTTSFRLSVQAIQIIKEQSQKHEISQADVVEMAIRKLAKSENIEEEKQ